MRPGATPAAGGADPGTTGHLIWRSAFAADAGPIAAAIDMWWAKHLRHFVHPIFLEHFGDTCLVAEDGGRLVAFLVGMLSQRHPEEAYVHFMGVHPDYRRLGLGRELYERFAAIVRERGRSLIVAETGAFNAQSVAFHSRLGFTLDDGDEVVDGVPVTRDFHGTGDDVVLFSKNV